MIIDSQYKVLEKFGEDAWAYTYKVKDLRTEKIYALKIFKKIDSKKLYNKFSAEDMHHITNMHHPNLVDVENFGNENDSIYYLSEYFPGISFAEFELTSRNHQELFDIIVQICYGLDTIHSQNILHRNIKPSNILFTKKEGKIDLKLLDYGFVATEDKAKRKKSRKEHLYISPEVLLGNQSTIQSDLFSLGITLYKVLTGKFPYSQDQIRSILINPKITLIPQFPSELNKKISTEIETIILKLIEINAENRYSSSQEIINYINEVQSKKYHISSKWKIINGIIINGYIAREKYTHDLLDILESDKQKNSIITIYSKDGMGKQNTLSLYRFHLLTGKYLIFDYTCSEENQDPFFALIKEFREYLKKIKTFNKKNLSMKFRRFLDSSNFDKDSTVNEPNDLQKDFQNAKNFLKHISKKKPLIFIIRSGEYLTQDSLKFVNYIKEELNNFPFTIIIGTKNQKTLNILNPDYKISLPQLTKAEARIFVFHLIHKRLPNQFLEHLLRKTNGIPKFIKYTLVDLIETRKIWKDNNFDFSYNFKNYRLHKSLQKLLFQRISSLENDSSDYKELISKLSVANMPLTKELILQILDNISASKYYAFIEACLENEVLIQQGKNYLFTFEEIRENLYRNSNKQTVSDISKRIITFYNSQNIDNTILKKLVVIAEEIEDFSKLRELRLQLYNYHKNHQDYYKAFIEISNIIKLDYSSKCTVTNQNMMKDLDYLLESAEITGSIKQALSIVDINDFPDIFEKFYTLGFFYLNIDNYKLAKENFEKAKNYVNTGRQKIRLTLTMISLYNRFNDLPKISKLLDFLENQDMPIEYEVSFVDKKATYINAIGHPIESIKYVHNFLKEVHSTNDYFTIVNLGSLYNNLAIVHIGLNNLKEGNEYYQKAKSLWSSINHKRPLPIIHNNLGDLALKQGYTNVAKKHFEKAYNMSILLQQPRSKILAALNFGEMYNKMGEFNKAEKYLIEAEELSHDINNFMFMSSINDNMAILYLKAKTFGEYYELIEKIAPEITQNVISKITPLTKTFFFYLLATGQLERISDILKNNNINFFNNHNEEFYYQIKWLIDSEKNETKIRENFSQSIKFAKKDNSQFALCILHIKLAQSYIYDDDYANSNIHYEKSIKIARTYNYQFWLMQLNILKVKIDLVEGNVSKRLLLRKLLAYLEEMKSQSYYQLELRVFEIIIQIYENLSLSNLSKHYFIKYKKLLKKMSKGLPKDDKSSFLLTRKYYTKKLNLFNTLKIEKNKKIWDSEQVSFLYKLLTIDSPDRIQFHIEKIIHMIFPAHKYAIVLFNKKSRDYRNICKTCDFFSNNADIHTNSIEKSFETDKAIRRKLNSKHLLYIPLGSAFLKIGCLIISDDGEFDIQKYEIRRLDLLRLPLTTLLVRIKDLEEIRNKERMIQQLIDLSNNLSHIIDISYLENEILKAAITFTKAMRGIFIRKNIYENHIYTSMLNNEGEDIVNPKNINKTLFMIAEETKVPQYTVSVNHNGITAYAFSIIIEKEFYGTVYLDVANLDSKELLIDDNYMNMFIDSATFLLTQTSFHNKINDRVNEVAHFSDLKSKFVSIVSHELNTPLTSLQKDITELKNSCSDENSSIIKLERKISSLSTKVKDLSTYQRYLISDRGELKFENIDITKLLEKQLQKIKDRLSQERNISFKTSFEENLSQIVGNKEAIGVAIYNIIHNAVRHSPNNFTVVVGAKHSNFDEEEIDNQETVVIYIDDKGDGIDREKQDLLSSSFYEGNDIVSHQSGDLGYHTSSFGVGLSTVYRIVEIHQAKIWFKSKPQKGTTFFIAFPILKNIE